MSQIERLLRAGALNRERTSRDARNRWLYWVDISEPALHRFDPSNGDDGL